MKITTRARRAWARYIVLGLIAIVGVAVGLYLSNMKQAPDPVEPPPAHFRFPLTAADAKDTLEAPVIASDAAGQVYLAWASRTGDDERTLYVTRSNDTGTWFDTPRVLTKSGVFKAVSQMKGKTVTRELRMVPHLATAGSTVHLAWTETLPDHAGVRLVTAVSVDAGTTFGSPVPVHQGVGARPTFTALAAHPDGSLLCSWLDNRNRAQQCYAAIRPARTTTFDAEQIVHAGDDDKGVCPCCPTAALLSPDGTAYVAFRNVANGYRDIAMGVRAKQASRFAIHEVVPPTWQFNGCPHDGPSIALVGDILHVAWMDARTNAQRCYHAWANVQDMKFTATELHPINSGTQGNAKLHTDAQGTLHAVWEESVGFNPEPAAKHSHEPAAPTVGMGGRLVMHRAWPKGASGFGPVSTVDFRANVFQSRPALTSTPNGSIIVIWNELDEQGKAVVVKRLDWTEGRR